MFLSADRTTVVFRWLVLLLLGLRASVFAWAAITEPVFVVGDFATDYLPRAEYRVENGAWPDADELALDFYLRPYGYSAVIAPLLAHGYSAEETVVALRLLNVVLESLSVLLLLLVIKQLAMTVWISGALALAMLVQPWTAGQVQLPGPDVLVMFLFSFSVVLLVCFRRDSRELSWTRLLICGLAAGSTLLLRAEMVVLAWVVPFAVAFSCAGPIRRRLALAGFVSLPIIMATMSLMAYSQHVQGRWNLWAGGESRFKNMGTTVWIRSWYGNQLEKTNIGWYWYRGQHLSMDFVPESAIVHPGDRAEIESIVLRSGKIGALSESDSARLADIGVRNKRERPFDWYLGIPLSNAWQMWRGSHVSEAWIRFWHSVNWRVPGILLVSLSAVVVAGWMLALVALMSASAEMRWMIAIPLLACVSRTFLFAVNSAIPEARYMAGVIPLALVLVIFGWNWFLAPKSSVGRLSSADRTGLRKQVVGR